MEKKAFETKRHKYAIKPTDIYFFTQQFFSEAPRQ